ncbi:MAG: porin [Gammaproteobacteria bacterium]|nr:porin [Gammaproteobacteria bacterium]
MKCGGWFSEEVATQREKSVPGQRTSIGGYGELHYNNLNDDEDAIGGDDSLSRADFHRFIIYLAHEFNDRMRFFSELEVEHSLVAGDGSSAGEVELEQAWIEMDVGQRHHARAGLDILPIGILNVTHEPNTFYGVERNRVESEIIPSTWWEAGVSAYGELAPGWNYDLVAHSGLTVETDGDAPFRPREGRLKVSQADDQDIAFTGRLWYTGLPGLEVGVSGQYQADMTGTADDVDIDATLFEGHVDWKHASGFGLRAIYARWEIGSDNGIDPGTVNADTLEGWYVEPAYRFRLPARFWGEAGIFARYSQWDERNRLAVPANRYVEFEQAVIGFNWWPHPNLVFKFDAQWEDADAEVDQLLDGFNLGVGYQF